MIFEKMSSPNKYAFRMILLLIIVMIISYLLYEPLKDALKVTEKLMAL